jgi:hypothetical protein
MLELTSGLFAWSQTVSAITSLIGTQWYPVSVTEQKAPPMVYVQEQKDAEDAQHDAPATAAMSRVTFTCVGRTPWEAAQLAGAVHDALITPRFVGAMGPVWVQGVLFKGSSPSYQWMERQFAVDADYDFCYNTAAYSPGQGLEWDEETGTWQNTSGEWQQQ